MTRLRLLTTPRLVDAAMAVHVADHANVDLVVAPAEVPTPGTERLIFYRTWQARRAFLAAAKPRSDSGRRSQSDSRLNSPAARRARRAAGADAGYGRQMVAGSDRSWASSISSRMGMP
jgi:hypothetical protein